MEKKEKIIYALLIIAVAGIAYHTGYAAGYENALNWGVEKAVYMLELKGYEVDLNTHLIASGLAVYQERVDKMFIKIKNASENEN